MSGSFYKITKGVSLNPQSQYSTSDPSDGVNGDIYYNLVLQKFRKFENGAWSNLSGGGGSGSASIWVADSIPVTSGSSSASVAFASDQPDLSYVVFAALENTTDPFPQFQEAIVTTKTISGFTATWNYPTDSANYNIVYIVPPKVFPAAETAIGSSATSIASNLFFPQALSNYPVLLKQQNLVDPSPQFQTPLMMSQSGSSFTAHWNSPTDSANYSQPYAIAATGQVAIGSGVTSVVCPLPVNYGTTLYAVIGMMYDLTDTFPQYQTVLTTVKTSSNFTASWNAPTDSANYVMVYYALSISP